MEEHNDAVNSVALSSNNKYLVSGGGWMYSDRKSEDNSIKIWDFPNGKLVIIYII